MTRDELDKFLKALEKAFPPDPKQLQEGIAKAQERLIKEYFKEGLPNGTVNKK